MGGPSSANLTTRKTARPFLLIAVNSLGVSLCVHPATWQMTAYAKRKDALYAVTQTA